MLTPELEERFKALLRKHVLFALLEDTAVEQLAQTTDVAAYPFGETVLTEGQPGDCAYLIHSGKARVFKNGPENRPITLTMLGAGDVFGEQAILHNILRTASIRAAEDLVLFRIRREDFERLLRDNAALRASVEKLVRQRTLMDFLRLHTVLQTLPARDLLALLDRFHEVKFLGGEVIVEEGDAPGFFIVRTGEVRFTRRAGIRDDEKLLGYRGPGGHFGDAVLLGTAVRERALAVRETVCLRLDQADFERALEETPVLRQRLNEIAGRHDDQTPAPVVPLAEETKPPRLQHLRSPQGRHPWLPQPGETDCGSTCLAMIARSHGIRLSVSRLRELAGTGAHGADMLGLATAAETVGFHSRAVRTDYGHLTGLDLPAIAHWKGYHFVVLYEVNERRVILGDPAVGILTLSRAEFEAGWTGRLLLLRPTPRLESQEPPRSTFQRFLPFVLAYRRPLLEAMLASLLLELTRLALPIFTQVVVDKVVTQGNVRLLNLLLASMVLLGIVQILAAVLRQYLLTHVGQRLGLLLRSDLYRQMLALPLRAFHSRRVGDFTARFEDSQRVQDIVAGRSVSALLDILVIVSSIGLMLLYSVRLSAIVLVTLPLYIIVTLIFTPLLRRQQRQAFERRALADSSLVDAVKAMAAIKDACGELAARWRYEEFIVGQSNMEYQGRRLSLVVEGVFRAVSVLLAAALLWYGASLVLDNQMTVGQLVAFNTLAAMAAVPILGLTQLWFELQNFALSMERLNDLYSAPKELHPESSATDDTTTFRREPGATDRPPGLAGLAALPHLPPLRGLIRFENVSFRFRPDERNILRNVTLEAQPGQTIAVVGRSGSGKTTLAMLLQRFYQPTEGRITLDGIDISKVDVRSLREQVSVVAQETLLITASIRENIALGDPDTPVDNVIEAARLACAHDFIMSFPLGYDTIVGEMGVRLSGGQKQRLALARALLKKPRILILDEATSALDSESERAVQDSLQHILKDRTVLVIAHRLSTVQAADSILVLDVGQIVEQGTHRDLLEKRGLYHYLVSQQLGG